MAYLTVDVELDVDAGDYLSSCNPKEIKELIKYLKEDGHLANIIDIFPGQHLSFFDEEWFKMLDKMSKIRQQMDSTDIQTIKDILNKY